MVTRGDVDQIGYSNVEEERKVAARYDNQIREYERQIEELRRLNDDNEGKIAVEPEDVTKSFIRLPEMLQKIHDLAQPKAETKYLQVMADPFSEDAVGA